MTRSTTATSRFGRFQPRRSANSERRPRCTLRACQPIRAGWYATCSTNGCRSSCSCSKSGKASFRAHSFRLKRRGVASVLRPWQRRKPVPDTHPDQEHHHNDRPSPDPLLQARKSLLKRALEVATEKSAQRGITVPPLWLNLCSMALSKVDAAQAQEASDFIVALGKGLAEIQSTLGRRDDQDQGPGGGDVGAGDVPLPGSVSGPSVGDK